MRESGDDFRQQVKEKRKKRGKTVNGYMERLAR